MKTKAKHQNLGVAATLVLRRKCIALNAHVRKGLNQWFKLLPEASVKEQSEPTLKRCRNKNQ